MKSMCGLHSHVELGSSSKFIQVFGRIVFIVVIGMRSPFSSSLSPVGHSHLLKAGLYKGSS